MIVRELFTIARQVELRVARLYEHLARNFEDSPELFRLLHALSGQEITHAQYVEEMLRASTDPEGELIFDTAHLTTFLDAIDDIEDEVVSEGVDPLDACEIVLHLEESIAEKFYERIPEGAEGVPDELVERMVSASREHARQVAAFAGRAREDRKD